jgi:hypothetical protein
MGGEGKRLERSDEAIEADMTVGSIKEILQAAEALEKMLQKSPFNEYKFSFFNVPIDNYRITLATPIGWLLPTLRGLLERAEKRRANEAKTGRTRSW